MDHKPIDRDGTADTAMRQAAAAVLTKVADAGKTGIPLRHLRVDLMTHGALDAHCSAFVKAILQHGYVLCDADGRVTATARGLDYLATRPHGATTASTGPECPANWTPAYSSWRHGGWYVHNAYYPSGAIGCVSRKFEDHRWRIVCDERRTVLGTYGDITFPNRDSAARAEYMLAQARSNWVVCGDDPEDYLLRLLAPAPAAPRGPDDGRTEPPDGASEAPAAQPRGPAAPKGDGA